MSQSQQPPTRHVLLVEPDPVLNRRVHRACGRAVRVTACHDFLGARGRLFADPPDLLITNLRLAEYNGLHLVLLSGTSGRTRCVVHTDHPDWVLIAEAQAAGAFFERTERLPYAVGSYLQAEWPASDRRDPRRFDRRATFRGGRRAADVTYPQPIG
jgi:DNA-binding NtrC family response regulator